MGTFKDPWSRPTTQEGAARPHVPAPQAQSLPAGAGGLPWCPRGKGGSQEVCRLLRGGARWVARRVPHSRARWARLAAPPFFRSPTGKEDVGFVGPYSQLWR